MQTRHPPVSLLIHQKIHRVCGKFSFFSQHLMMMACTGKKATPSAKYWNKMVFLYTLSPTQWFWNHFQIGCRFEYCSVCTIYSCYFTKFSSSFTFSATKKNHKHFADVYVMYLTAKRNKLWSKYDESCYYTSNSCITPNIIK